VSIAFVFVRTELVLRLTIYFILVKKEVLQVERDVACNCHIQMELLPQNSSDRVLVKGTTVIFFFSLTTCPPVMVGMK